MTHAFAVGLLTRKYTEDQLVLFSVVLSCISYVGIAFSYQIGFLLVFLIPYVFSAALASTCITSTITKLVTNDDIGMTLGVSDALESLGRVLTPTIGGILLGTAGTAGAPLVSSTMTGLLSLYIWLYLEGSGMRKKELQELAAEEDQTQSVLYSPTVNDGTDDSTVSQQLS